MTQTRTLTLALGALGLWLGLSAAAAARTPLDDRRTLHLAVAQRQLVLEAPKNMCFLDRSDYSENMLFTAIEAAFREKSNRVLLAVFVDCIGLANLGGEASPDDLQLNAGTVAWLNPTIGETTTLPRPDYLDMREASFRQYAAALAPGLKLDERPRRTETSVLIGMSGEVKIDYQLRKVSGVLATTSLHDVPLEVMLSYTDIKAPPLEQLRPLMDKLMAQQVALNE